MYVSEKEGCVPVVCIVNAASLHDFVGMYVCIKAIQISLPAMT